MRAIERGAEQYRYWEAISCGRYGGAFVCTLGGLGFRTGSAQHRFFFFFRDIAVRAGVLVRVWRLHMSGR